jgi:predicted NACHT family NTPase
MSHFHRRRLLINLSAWLLAALIGSELIQRAASAQDDKAKELPAAATVEVDFDKHVHPILKKACLRCHDDKKKKSNYQMDSRENLIKGGDIGKAVVEGKSAESPLIKYVSGLDPEIEMPPSGDPLTKEEIGLLRAWIDQGVKWSAKPSVAEVEKPKEEKATYTGHTGLVTAVAFAPGTPVLASAGGQSLPFRPGEVKLWDLATGQEKLSLPGLESAVWSVAFSKDGSLIATGSYGKKVKVFEAASGKEVAAFDGHKNWVTCVAFSPDGSTLASGSEDTTIKLWDLKTQKERATLSGHTGTVRDLAFSTGGQLLASASLDGTIKLWDAASGAEKSTLEGHKDGVFSIAFSPNDQLLASGGADAAVAIWETATGKKFSELKGHKNWVVSVAFSPDGATVASGGYDKQVKLWDAMSGQEKKSYEGHQSAVWSVAFAPDGALVASGSQDGTVKLWENAPAPKPRRTMRF